MEPKARGDAGAPMEAKSQDYLGQTLLSIQKSIEDLGANVSSLERKIDAKNDSPSLLQGVAKMDKGQPRSDYTDNVQSQVREELGNFQRVLLDEFKTHHTTLKLEMQQLRLGMHRDPLNQSPPSNVTLLAAKADIPVMTDMPARSDSGAPQASAADGSTNRRLSNFQMVEQQSLSVVQAGDFEQRAVAALHLGITDAVDAADVLAPEKDDFVPGGSSLSAVFSNDDNPAAEPYCVEDLYFTNGIAQTIARMKLFENCNVLVVVINAVYIGVDADYNKAMNIYDADPSFLVFSQFFCVYFTMELVIRFMAFEKKASCLRDGWFKFDAFLVSTMIADIWVLMPVMHVVSSGGQVNIPTQPLRMLRLFKLTRMARLMHVFPELVTMIKGLFRSLRAISSTGILIALMVYTWAILMHMLLKDEVEFNKSLYDELEMNFATITNCIWILILCGTLLLDGASVVMTQLIFSERFPLILAGLAFLSFACLSALLILQMLIGVLCDVVTTVGAEQRDALAIGLVKCELLGDLKKFDDGDGKISQSELMCVMNNPNSIHLIGKLNINRLFFLQLAKMMFSKPGTQVPIKDVLELMILCRGDNTATVQSMAGGFGFMFAQLIEVRNQMLESIEHIKAPSSALTQENSETSRFPL